MNDDVTEQKSKYRDGNSVDVQYVGFWARVIASLVDTLAIVLISWPILFAIYGKQYFEMEALIAGPADFLLSWVLPVVAVLTFWMYKQATPGKMLFSAKIIDAKTGNKPSKAQYIIRYLGYFLSLIPFGFGMLSVGWDKKKQGWHDKLAGTVVISEKKK